MHKAAGKSEVDPAFRPKNTGRLEDSNSYHLGNWMQQTLGPSVFGPIRNATKARGSFPGWGNAMLTGGLAGATLGGLYNKYLNDGSFGRGAGWGALGGSLGLMALGGMMSGPEWSSKIPLVGNLLSPKRPGTGSDPDKKPSAWVSGRQGHALTDLTHAEQRKELMEKNNSIKAAAWGSAGGSTNDIARKLYQDTSLTLMQKQELANQVRYLDANQARRLSQLVGGAFGSGIGYLVAKYLLGLGKFGTILTTIVSGLSGIGISSGPKPKPTHDSMGRPYYL